MSDGQPPRQPPTPSPKEKYSDPRRSRSFSPSLRRASYRDDDMIWPAPSDVYSDAQPTLPPRGREFSVRLNLPTLIVLGSVALLLIAALFASLVLRNTPHSTIQSTAPGRGGAIAQATVPISATLTPPPTSPPTLLPAATPGGGKPVIVPTRGSTPPGATKLPAATPTPLICDTLYRAGSPVTLFGDDGVSGGSGSGTTIGSLGTYVQIDRAVSGNECIVTRIQQIVNVNLNTAPETTSARCSDSPYPCTAQGTLIQIDQSTHQVVSTDTKGYPFSGQVSRNIYGGTDSSPPGGNQCATGTSEYFDSFSVAHQGGNIVYCWSS